jgi:hypothetical protein
MVLLATLYFASLRPGYSHISNTISELGETGASQAHLVAFAFFLPVGLIVWRALWLVRRYTSDGDTLLVLLALSGLGAGYVLAALFPCDPGGPLFGSWRTLVHNTAGVIDYGGTALGFLLFCRYCATHKMRRHAFAFGIAGVRELSEASRTAVMSVPLGTVPGVEINPRSFGTRSRESHSRHSKFR